MGETTADAVQIQTVVDATQIQAADAAKETKEEAIRENAIQIPVVVAVNLHAQLLRLHHHLLLVHLALHLMIVAVIKKRLVHFKKWAGLFFSIPFLKRYKTNRAQISSTDKHNAKVQQALTSLSPYKSKVVKATIIFYIPSDSKHIS